MTGQKAWAALAHLGWQRHHQKKYLHYDSVQKLFMALVVLVAMQI